MGSIQTVKALNHLFLACLFSPVVALAAKPPEAFSVCLDYHCDIQQLIKLDGYDWAQVLELLPERATTPAQERIQIKNAIAKLEELVGKRTMIWKDQAKNEGEGSEIGQLDCIAESKNTSAFLQLLEKEQLLTHHQLQERAVRNPNSFSVHWTAVVKDLSTQRKFAVDSWVFKNGTPPIIQPLEAWKRKEPFGNQIPQ